MFIFDDTTEILEVVKVTDLNTSGTVHSMEVLRGINGAAKSFPAGAKLTYFSDVSENVHPTWYFCEPTNTDKHTAMPAVNMLDLSYPENSLNILRKALSKLSDRKYGTQGKLARSQVEKIYKGVPKNPRDRGSTLDLTCYEPNDCMFIKLPELVPDEGPINVCDEVIEPVICINGDEGENGGGD